MAAIINSTLLNILLSTKEPIKSSELAFILDVSEKTVLKHLNNLKQELNENGATIEIKQGAGSYLVVTDETLFKQYNQELARKLDLSDPDIRKSLILLTLLVKGDYINSYELAELFYISPSLLRQILRGLQLTLEKYSLSLEHNHTLGYRIIGDEKNIRKCISKECSTLTSFNSVIATKDFQQNEMELIHKIVTESLKHFNISINESGINSLTLHIMIAINRMETNNLIKVDYGMMVATKLRSSPEFYVASMINRSIKEELNIELPENELLYLTMHLTGKQRLYGHEHIQVEVTTEALVFYNKFLRNIYKMANEDFFEDEELRVSLLNHIVPFLNRVKNELLITKTDLPNIKNEFPYAYELAIFGLSMLEGKTLLTSAEISYFALHLALSIEKSKEDEFKFNVLVVCNKVTSVFQILSYKLDKLLKNRINMIKFISKQDLETFDPSDYDLILNTGNDPLNVPSLKVSNFINDTDAALIIEALDSIKQKERFFELMPSSFFIESDAKSPIYVLQELVKTVETKLTLPTNFITRVLEREHYETTEYDNRVATPHPLDNQNVPTFIAVARLNKPILWRNKQVQLVFLFSSLGTKNATWFFAKISKIVQDSSTAQLLLGAKDYKEFIECFEKNRVGLI